MGTYCESRNSGAMMQVIFKARDGKTKVWTNSDAHILVPSRLWHKLTMGSKALLMNC